MEERGTKKRGKMNGLRRLSHLASVWIIRYCYSCGASRCAQPQAVCKSWMTVTKDSDKLIDFCEGVKRHSEGSFIDRCARCLLVDARDILVSCEGCFSAQGPRPCQDYRKMMWFRFGDRFYFLPGFCSGDQSVVSTSQEERVHITWPDQKPGHPRIPAQWHLDAPTTCVKESDIWADHGCMCSEQKPMCSYLIKPQYILTFLLKISQKWQVLELVLQCYLILVCFPSNPRIEEVIPCKDSWICLYHLHIYIYISVYIYIDI